MSSLKSKPPGIGTRASGVTASLVALTAGLFLGIATSSTQTPLLQGLQAIVEPIGYLWLNALQMTVIPLVLANLVASVMQAGGAREVGWLSAVTVIVFVAFLLAAGVATAMSVPLALSFLPVDDASVSSLSALSERANLAIEASSAKSTFSRWLIELFPTNPFKALAEGDLLPLMVFTIFFGLALSRAEPANREVAHRFFLAVAQAMMILVGWILVFTPLGVFALAMTISTSMGGDAAGLIVQYLVLICGFLLAVTLLLYPATSLLAGIAPGKFARGVLPAQIVAVGTRSSLASLPALLKAAETRLQVDPEVARLTLPLCVSTFKLNRTVSATLKVLLIAHLFGIEVGAAELATFMLTIIIMSFSALGVPLGGGGIRALPAYMAAGVPIEALILFEAVEAIPDIFKTLLNVTGDMSVALIVHRVFENAVTARAVSSGGAEKAAFKESSE